MVPTFDKFMFPILNLLKDEIVRSNKEIQIIMRDVFSLSDDDIAETTPKGTVRYLGNVNWALTFLYQAKLTSKPRQGRHTISELGKQFLAEGNTELTERTLVARYGNNSPKFFFPSGQNDNISNDKDVDNESVSHITPEEAIHQAAQTLDEALISELLEQVKAISPADFEKLVVKLLVKMGYGGSIEDAASVTKYTGDEGIDGVIKEDVLGLDSIYIQAKHFTSGTVGRPDIQAFVGALSPKHAKKGVFITTSSFSSQAVEYAKAAEAKIILIDGHQLCKYMLQFNLGVSTKEVIEIKTIDTDFFNFE